jgi:ribosomal protein S18 acetylase RimI-like enzyme
MEDIEIKKVAIRDIEALAQIGRQTFAETFSAGNTEDNMAKYLEEGFSVHKLEAELSDEYSQFYFAIAGGDVIGYFKLNTGKSQTELKDVNAVEIERIYVLKAHHGKKVGQLLYEKAIQIATELNAEYVWLGVWEENQRAINFYKKKWFYSV